MIQNSHPAKQSSSHRTIEKHPHSPTFKSIHWVTPSTSISTLHLKYISICILLYIYNNKYLYGFINNIHIEFHTYLILSSHFLQFFPPGCPTVDILQRFLSTCESLTSPSTAFAVHCRSGLGRTATLIGAYAIRHCGFTARAWVKAEFSMFFFVGRVGLSILTIYIYIYVHT